MIENKTKDLGVSKRCEDIRTALLEIEQALRSSGLWTEDSSRPNKEAFLSTVPFCLDTMDLHCWFQYVLIPKFYELLKTPEALPEKLCVHTVAEEYYRGKWREYRSLLAALRRFDALFENK
ncbi:MAG: YqcC family protein [Succinatimonas sp.]|nr:YqcC family protein [Succinatimonas sp.]